MDRHLTILEGRQLALVVINQNNVMAEVGETGSRH